jgi:hypothetical protein
VRRSLIAAALGAALVVGACRPDTVHISFKPPSGGVYRYDVHVRAVSVSALGTARPRRSVDDFVLHAEHRVAAVGAHDTEVQVTLDIPGVGRRTFSARFDRGAQLTEIQRIEGVPAAALGQLGLSELLPGAAGAPPQRALSPGDRWTIDSPAALLGGGGARLRGQGRLAELGVIRGHDVATIESRYHLPVKRTAEIGNANIELDGVQTTAVTTVRTLADGAVESANAVTRGTFEMTLVPPDNSGGAPVGGNLTIEVTSKTTRAR